MLFLGIEQINDAMNPTDPFTTLGLHNQRYDVPKAEQHKNSQSPDCEALKL